ncbi:MAG: N-acetylmuramoyl-L-alanine amidase [Deltaproteobacteria bacterium]|nr:N-acetylmuramoyl-L-alanine amidase [Deltaproteobacteria bacterium]
MRRLIPGILIAIFVFVVSSAYGFVVGPDGRPYAEPVSYVVVIDAGHGGDDSGAMGRGGSQEKAVNLAVALKVAESLRKHQDIKVLMTRSDDTFVPLHDRAVFANNNNAAVFISIHSNAATSKKANGIETFFLSVDATDDEARDLAVIENAVVTPDVAATLPRNDDIDIKDILYDLTRTEAHHESSVLAESVQGSLCAALGKENRGVKQAPFAVLSGAMMPAALVEIGFISNAAEEKRLLSAKEQAKIADSITKGILDFKKTTSRGWRIVNKTARKD